MKVLLDENLDHALRKLLGQHEVVTVAYMGWTGLKNGELLRTAEDHGFEVLLTGDRTLNYEQNFMGRRLAIVVISAIQLPIIKKNLPKIIAVIDNAAPGSFQTVACGTVQPEEAAWPIRERSQRHLRGMFPVRLPPFAPSGGFDFAQTL